MSLKVLAVDNNPVLLHAVSTLLKKQGCEVVAAETGIEAIKHLETFSPDMVVIDLVMPLVSGEQLCRILRNSEKNRDVFIVVLSGIVVEDKKRILQEIDCNLCLAKGSLQEIKEQIKYALDEYKKADRRRKRESHQQDSAIPDRLKPSAITRELLDHKQHLATIFDNLTEGILELSSDGRIVFANKAVFEILDFQEESNIGRYLEDLQALKQVAAAFKSWREDALVAGGGQQLTFTENDPLVLGESGDKIVTAICSVVAGRDNTRFGLCTFRDITRQHNAEKQSREMDEALRLVRKMDTVSCMAGGVAHDFNNLLTVICGNLDILTHCWNRTDEKNRLDLLKQTKKTAFTAVDLTRRISHFSNFGIINRQHIAFDVLVEEAVYNFTQNTEISCQCHLAETNVDVKVDPEDIKQAIGNVLQNCIEAAPDKRVCIENSIVTFTEAQLIAGQYIPAGCFGEIKIRDEGPGIPRDALFKVFDPYFSTKQRGPNKGLGLGLAIVYSIFRNHGGHVVVESSVAKQAGDISGTTVSLYLPVFEKKENVPCDMTALAGKIVLVIEPDPQMRTLVQFILEHLGLVPRIVKNREEAVRELEKNAASSEEAIDVGLVEIAEEFDVFPKETTRMLKACNPDIQLIAVSGTLHNPVMENFRKYGFVSTVAKPYSMDSMRHALCGVLS